MPRYGGLDPEEKAAYAAADLRFVTTSMVLFEQSTKRGPGTDDAAVMSKLRCTMYIFTAPCAPVIVLMSCQLRHRAAQRHHCAIHRASNSLDRDGPAVFRRTDALHFGSRLRR
jgi:hypothetical protein